VLLREEGAEAVLEGAVAGAVEVGLRIIIETRRNLVLRQLQPPSTLIIGAALKTTL